MFLTVQTQRETVFHRPEKERGTGPYDDNDFDDNASNNSDESCNRSVRSFRSNGPSVRSSFIGGSSAYNSNPGSPHGGGGNVRSSFLSNTSQHNSTSNSSHGFYANNSSHGSTGVLKPINGTALPPQHSGSSNSHSHSTSGSNSGSTSTASKLSSFFGMNTSSSATSTSSTTTTPGGGGGSLGILGGLGLGSASQALGKVVNEMRDSLLKNLLCSCPSASDKIFPPSLLTFSLFFFWMFFF